MTMMPSPPGQLTANHIHVWLLDLTPHTDRPWQTSKWLSPDEQARAANTGNPAVRHSFVLVRSALRWLLANYLGTSPADIHIVSGIHGKPELATTRNENGLVFNVTHSGNFALLVFGLHRRLGVDLEALKARRNLAALAEKTLTPRELELWTPLNDQDRLLLFYRWWVCKEAFGKAVGLGLQVGLTACSIDPHAPRLLEIPREHGTPASWNLEYLNVASDVVASLCYSEPLALVECAILPQENLSL